MSLQQYLELAVCKQMLKKGIVLFRTAKRKLHMNLHEKEARRMNPKVCSSILPYYPFLTTHSPHGGKNPYTLIDYVHSCLTRKGGCSNVHWNC